MLIDGTCRQCGVGLLADSSHRTCIPPPSQPVYVPPPQPVYIPPPVYVPPPQPVQIVPI